MSPYTVYPQTTVQYTSVYMKGGGAYYDEYGYEEDIYSELEQNFQKWKNIFSDDGFHINEAEPNSIGKLPVDAIAPQEADKENFQKWKGIFSNDGAPVSVVKVANNGPGYAITKPPMQITSTKGAQQLATTISTASPYNIEICRIQVL